MGSVVISVEVDPRRPDDDGAGEERYRETLSAWRRASYCFDRHEIPATWLVAGHLFVPARRRTRDSGRDGSGASRRAADEERAGTPQRSADDRKGTSRGQGEEPNASPCVRPDHPTDPTRFADESTADRTRSTRSAPDLIEAICRSRVAHEIGCQPFSRLDVGDASQDDAVAAVRACIDAAAELGVRTDRLRAVAVPDDWIGHRDVLAAYGFACYREPQPATDGPLASLRILLWLMGRRLARTGPPLVEPETDEHGLLALPTSMGLFPLAGSARAAARAGRGDTVAGLAKRGVDHAAESGGILHLQLRPQDLRTRADFERLEAVLEHVADRQAETDLRVETMGRVARRLGEYGTTPTAPLR